MYVTLLGIIIYGVLALNGDPAPSSQAILLPDADGKVGRIILSNEQSSQEIATAYGAAKVGKKGEPILPFQESAQSVEARHAALLATLPKPAKSYILYFKEGSDELEEQSQPVLDTLKQDVEQRPHAEIRIIGHTDTVGSEDANDELSRQRAETVAADLTRLGIHPASFEAVGRGERALLVPTEDNVSEPRNRRVEISVR